MVPPYAVRPVDGGTVSTPLDWDELTADLTPALFTIRTVPERLAARGEMFRAVLEDRQDLVPAIAALEERMKG